MQDYLVRGLKFSITGIANTGIHFLVATSCLTGFIFSGSRWALDPVLANAVAFAIATLFSYIVNTMWSFSTTMNHKNLMRFMAVSIIGLLIAMLLAKIAELIGLTPIWGVVLVVSVMPLINFGLHSLWTFR